MPTYEQPELPFDPPLAPPATWRESTTQPSVEARVTALEKRVQSLEDSRPGRRGTPIEVSEEGVCGIDPECDSATCDKASVYRWQRGCRGEACGKAYREYYSAYRKRRRGTETAEVEDYPA